MVNLAALRKKLKNKKGFTLMEMLIVVAIIVILLAIAIPSFNNALRKSKVTADQANVRSWYAEIMLDAMTDPDYTLPSGDDAYKGADLQITTATVAVTGDTAETFKVTYATDKADESITFGSND